MNSIVIPVYKNEENIAELISSLHELHMLFQEPLEVVFVIDGSPDQSERLLCEKLEQASFQSQLISHSRNFGAFAAIRTGLRAAKGNLIAVMAADLQEPISLVLEFFQILQNEPVDLCVGTRKSRNDPILTRLSSACFWKLYRLLIIPEMPAGGIDIFACKKLIANTLLELNESHSSLVAQLIWIGFRRREVPYDRQPRLAGRSAWTFKRRFNYMLDSVFSFTDRPLKAISLIGILGILFCIIFGSFLIAARLGGWITVPGYSALALLILFSSFLNLSCLGIVGQYAWRGFENSKSRPSAIVRDVRSFQPPLLQEG